MKKVDVKKVLKDGREVVDKIKKKYFTVVFVGDVQYLVRVEGHPSRTQQWSLKRRAHAYKKLLVEEYGKSPVPTITRIVYDKNRYEDLSLIFSEKDDDAETLRLSKGNIAEIEGVLTAEEVMPGGLLRNER